MPVLISVIEDEESILELIGCALDAAGYETARYESAEHFLQELPGKVPELILLDIMLPGMDGTALLAKLKADERYRDIPVIFLTARDSELDRASGLERGADDYIGKPFGIIELQARVKAVLRRTRTAPPEKEQAATLTAMELAVDLHSKEVRMAGVPVKLTYKEYELLVFLMEHRGRVATRERLLEHIWGMDYLGDSRTVDMHIRSLRQKLGDSSDAPRFIATARGYGYKFLKE